MGTGGLALRRIRARVTEKPTGFVWIEEDRLAGSGYPASRGQLEWLRRQGIRTILTLTERALPSKWLEGLDLEVQHIPMNDHGVPDQQVLDRAASFVHECLENHKVTLVHCLAGEGRTGSVLAAFMIKENGVSGEEAIRTLRRIKPEFIEPEQEEAILRYGLKGKQ